MANDSGKKSKKKKKQKKSSPENGAKPASSKTAAAEAGQRQSAKKLKVSRALESMKSATSRLAEQPLVTDIVAAALVATAAALKDPDKARRLAADAGDELQAVAEQSTAKAGAFWSLALEIARRSIEALESGADDESSVKSPKRKA